MRLGTSHRWLHIQERPLVLNPEANPRAWLDPELPGRVSLQQLTPEAHCDALESWRVGDAARNATNEGTELIAQSRQGVLF